MLASCNHGNIIRYIDAYVEERCLYIVMEFADGGNILIVSFVKFEKKEKIQ